MGLTFYIGEIQAQGSEAAQMNQQASQAIVSLQSSISQFLSAPLSGKAYDSAKNYFSVVYTPLCRSAMMTGEALERAHKQLLSEYQGMVSSIDTDEDKINSQIDRLEQLKRELERQMHVSKTMRPDLERRYINACEVIAKKRELLEKFHAYNARSASIFSEYDACQQEFNTGLAQVKDCQAWNASTGTFDISRLNMTWAKSINDRWDKRAKELEKQRAKKFAKGMKDRYYQRVQLASGAYVWMWVKDPMNVSQEDFQFNEKYKDYLKMLMEPETSIFDEYYQTLAEELRTGINQRTGEPLTDLEKAQRWAEVASALALVAVGAYYGKKGFTEGKKASGAKSSGKDLFNYTNKVNEHMSNPDRAVPAQTLKEAIKGGTPMPDPRGSNATMYYSEIYINGKKYNFEVLYDKATNTIYHFKYDRRPLGPLPAVPKQ